MSESAVLESPTLQSLAQTVHRLEERVEDLEDLRDLEQAIVENGDTPLIPWEEAKKQLDLG
jgi:hypothetical protein